MNINIRDLIDNINPSFKPLLVDQNRFMILRGGAGSGKSYFAAQKCILRILLGMVNGQTHNILVVRKTSPSGRRSTFPLIKEIMTDWYLRDLIHINKTEQTFTFKNGSKIQLIGLDDPEKLKSIHGITSVWCEEATELSKEDFEQINMRLRGKNITDYFQIILSFNPISKYNWVYQRFFENGEEENTTYHHSTYQNNEYLDEAYKDQLENYINSNQNIYNVYTKGEWGSYQNVIFTNWTTVENDAFPQDSSRVKSGLDFGYNNPSALVRIVKTDEALFLDELLYQQKLTNKALALKIKSKFPWLIDNYITIYCDAAEPDRISELKSRGIRALPAKKGTGSVMRGIDWLQRRNIKVTERSKNLITELASYSYGVDKAQNPIDEPAAKQVDHAIDAVRYACTPYIKTGSTPQIFVL